uniref:Calreticulin 3 n=1 Tax=Sphenodon punctatus TaxID=8508 RepID=A0A8D0GY78_SPHPU
MEIEIERKVDGFTHLYTLILRPDQTYEVKIDNEQVESGSLEDDWDFLPPRTINDPTVNKPEDWDDVAEIDDPKDVKPEVRSGTIFDNFLITDNEEYAEEFGDDTWGETKDAEQRMSLEQSEAEQRKKRVKQEKRRVQQPLPKQEL